MEKDTIKRVFSLQIWEDLTRQVEVLQRLPRVSGAVFWFTTAAANNKPLLLLEKDKERLKKILPKVGSKGKIVRGKVVYKNHKIVFTTKQKAPGFIAFLASWVAVNQELWPNLGVLKGATLVTDGVEYRDESVWKK